VVVGGRACVAVGQVGRFVFSWSFASPEGTAMEKMPPAVERLVRLMVLLPDHDDPLWASLIADCGSSAAVMSMRWHVGDSAKMWPEGAPRALAEAALSVFGPESETSLGLISDAILLKSGQGPHAGAAWVRQAQAAAIEVLAQHDSLEEVLRDAKERWSLR
jgi:hypothetical protein